MVIWDISIFEKLLTFLYFLFSDDKYSITSELRFSAGIDSSNFEMEKGPLEKFLYGILKKDASFVKITDVEVTLKKEFEFPTPSRTQTSTGSILLLTIGPFEDDKAEGIKEFVNSGSLFNRFQEKNVNSSLVLDKISNTSKYKLWIFIAKSTKNY